MVHMLAPVPKYTSRRAPVVPPLERWADMTLIFLPDVGVTMVDRTELSVAVTTRSDLTSLAPGERVPTASAPRPGAASPRVRRRSELPSGASAFRNTAKGKLLLLPGLATPTADDSPPSLVEPRPLSRVYNAPRVVALRSTASPFATAVGVLSFATAPIFAGFPAATASWATEPVMRSRPAASTRK